MQPVERKTDSQEIEDFLDGLESQAWLKTGPKRWWPKFLFFFSDIRNIVSILGTGKLLSRNEADRRKLLVIDSASQEVLGNTDPSLRDYVRLYFGPRTPTQFRNEGMRPKDKQELGAHCPVPVFLLFNSRSVLTLSGCQFSDGSGASSIASIGSDAKFLKGLQFRKIYHRGPYNTVSDHDIKFHRHAEVLIPNELDLSNLRFIFCRSPAEKEMLLHLLADSVRQEWEEKVFVDGKQSLFEKRWTFVERVELSSKRVVFHFSPDTCTPGPFEVHLTLCDLDEGVSKTKTWPDQNASGPAVMNFSKALRAYDVKLELDGNLAYASRFVLELEDIPF